MTNEPALPTATVGAYGSRNAVKGEAEQDKSALLYRDIHSAPRHVVASKGSWLYLSNGTKLLDATCGAAVSCLGHDNKRVQDAINKQIGQVSYCLSTTLGTQVAEELADELIRGTGGLMKKAYIVGSGSEAMDAAMKFARQYFLELPKPQRQRVNFIARNQSYHGTTLGPLSLGGNAGRRYLYEPLLMTNCSRVSPCYEYRERKIGESIEEYVDRLAQELDDEFQRIGPDTVCGFVAEPIVGATLGCVPAVPGYFRAMRSICDKYGALFILDEVMSGMGRCGTLHAWQAEGVVPDLQTIGKGLGGGFLPIAGLLIGHRLVEVLFAGSGAFAHGHTYQGHPVVCASALEVQKQIREDNLIENVTNMGHLLERLLKERLGKHKYVGDIRGRGLFWGIEFVKNRETKEPFDPKLGVAFGVHEKGLTKDYAISVYPGTGTADGIRGDHILLAPAYNVTAELIEETVDRTGRLIEDYFSELDSKD